MANFINKYASQALYDADSTKQYPNVSLVNGSLAYQATDPCYRVGTAEDFSALEDALSNFNWDDELNFTVFNNYENAETLQSVWENQDIICIQNLYDGLNEYSWNGEAVVNCNGQSVAITTEFDDTYEVDGAPVDAHLIHFPFGTIGYYDFSGDTYTIIDITADRDTDARYDVSVIYPDVCLNSSKIRWNVTDGTDRTSEDDSNISLSDAQALLNALTSADYTVTASGNYHSEQDDVDYDNVTVELSLKSTAIVVYFVDPEDSSNKILAAKIVVDNDEVDIVLGQADDPTATWEVNYSIEESGL